MYIYIYTVLFLYMGSVEMAGFFNSIWESVCGLFSNPLSLILDIFDIALISVIFYIAIKFIRDTRATQLLKGISLLIILLLLTNWLGLTGTHYILNTFLEFGVLALVIIFQPELRSALEKIGRKGVFRIFSCSGHILENSEDEKAAAIELLCGAISRMSVTKTGALLVMERQTKVGDIIKTGTVIDANISTEIITNIFFPKAPLHDGAMVIRDFKIAAAGCFLPLSTKRVDSDLGTRHRAAIGMSEISDAIVIVVSEETGIISVATDGFLKRNYTYNSLKEYLTDIFIPEKTDVLSRFRKEKKQ